MSLFIKVLTTGGNYSLLSPSISHLAGLLVHYSLSSVCFLLLIILFLSAHILYSDGGLVLLITKALCPLCYAVFALAKCHRSLANCHSLGTKLGINELLLLGSSRVSESLQETMWKTVLEKRCSLIFSKGQPD